MVKRKSSRKIGKIFRSTFDYGSCVTAGDFGFFHCRDLFEGQCLFNRTVKVDKECLWQQVSNLVMRAKLNVSGKGCNKLKRRAGT